MRNNKGMTLIETVVAILVLSIAGTIIISGFYIVIHTMSEANVVKQQSNDILSFAEKAKKNNVDSSAVENSSYSITKKDFTTFDVPMKISDLKTKGNDAGKVTLKALNNENLLNIQEAYPDLMTTAEKLHEDTLKREQELDSFARNENYNVSVLKPYYASLNSKWPLFPLDLLPSDVKATASSANPYYFKLFYPWEFYNSGSPLHNGRLIYLSQINEVYPIVSRDGTISLRIFYDYIDDVWYYTKSNDYILDSDMFSMNYKANLSCLYKKLGATNNLKFKSYADFLSHVKSPANGWYVLNMKAIYNSENADEAWVLLKN